MKLTCITTGLLALAFASSAQAGHCPKDAKAIKHALEHSSIDMSSKKNILNLTDKGMELHKAGNHRESERVLAEAMRKTLMSE